MGYNKPVVTNLGMSAVVDFINENRKIPITKIALSDTDLSSFDHPENMTKADFGAYKQDAVPTVSHAKVFIVEGSTKIEKDALKTDAIISNIDISTTYYIKSIGIFANDINNNEILFAIITTTGPKYDEVPAYDGHTPVNYNSVINLIFDRVEELQVEVNNQGVATQEYVYGCVIPASTKVDFAVADFIEQKHYAYTEQGVTIDIPHEEYLILENIPVVSFTKGTDNRYTLLAVSNGEEILKVIYDDVNDIRSAEKQYVILGDTFDESTFTGISNQSLVMGATAFYMATKTIPANINVLGQPSGYRSKFITQDEIDKNNEYFGKICDYEFDVESGRISKIYISMYEAPEDSFSLMFEKERV